MLNHPAIYTDLYELTMAQGYFLEGRADERAGFDYFFRDLPFGGGYVVFAGLGDLLPLLKNFKFQDDELAYLLEQGFHESFVNYLKNLELSVTIKAPKEGEIVFPVEPVITVEGPIIEAQILETLLLNIINFESLIATKAQRIKFAAGKRGVLDFGLRRAQGYGGIQASKAAAIGGVEPTSNVLAGFKDGIGISGTMAHSWIQSFEDELTAFRAYARHYPDECILLVDTYDTLAQGVPNAIKVAKELEKSGHQLKGIRLDSGDLTYFSRKARNQLDRAGLEYVKIAASNQLDEFLITSLLNQRAPIDLFGVGTRLVTGDKSPALDGVYKLNSVNGLPKLKISENVEKITLPGLKKTMRYLDKKGFFLGDGIWLNDETTSPQRIYHPFIPAQSSDVTPHTCVPVHQTIMKNGEMTIGIPTVKESAQYAESRFKKLNSEHKRFENPHIYKVGASKKLMNLRNDLIDEVKNRHRRRDG